MSQMQAMELEESISDKHRQQQQHQQQQHQMVVEVVAPCSMDAGYTFAADYGDISFRVTVPPGGVKQGDIISVPMPSWTAATSEVTPFLLRQNNHTSDSIRTGKWKDSLWACCRYGLCHATLLNAICCPQILMAQILTRMKMNVWGDPAPDHEWKSNLRNMLLAVGVYWILTVMLAPPSSQWVFVPSNDADSKSAGGIWTRQDPPPTPLVQTILYHTLSWSFGLYTCFVLTKLRRAVRARYQISNSRQVQCYHNNINKNCEDLCVSFWCGCCSVAQLARQTADYDTMPASCCSATGLCAQEQQQQSFLVV